LEIDVNKKGCMKYGSKISIFNTSDYDLNLEERRAKYKGYYAILCEECNQEIDKYYFYCTGCYKEETDINKKRYMIYGSTFEIFNTSDYNLNLEERRAKYMFKYKYTILCEKCNNEFNGRDHYCIYCYREESNINKKRYLKYGSNFKIF
jgi:predicted amidophosphoribosyltransferase